MGHTSDHRAGDGGRGSTRSAARSADRGADRGGRSGGRRRGGGVREAQKAQTRQALLDAGLRLLDRQSLSSLGLREVTREAGITPTAFYRHFRDLEELGEALVEESFGPLRGLVLEVRLVAADPEEVIDRSVDAIARHVDEHPAHFRFVTRERFGGVRRVRDAISARLADFAADLTAYFAAQPDGPRWTLDDLRMLADLYVDHMVITAAKLLESEADSHGVVDEEAEAARRTAITDTARRQLRLISAGRRAWTAAPEAATAAPEGPGGARVARS